MSEDTEPIAPLGTMFWFRPQVLKILFDRIWDYPDFPKEPNSQDGNILQAIEHIYPFVTQQAGYYTGWVLADTFAKLEITNLNFMLSELNKNVFQIYGINTHRGLINTMQSFIINGSGKKDVNRALLFLLKEKIRRSVPKRIWDFLRKIIYFLTSRRVA